MADDRETVSEQSKIDVASVLLSEPREAYFRC